MKVHRASLGVPGAEPPVALSAVSPSQEPREDAAPIANAPPREGPPDIRYYKHPDGTIHRINISWEENRGTRYVPTKEEADAYLYRRHTRVIEMAREVLKTNRITHSTVLQAWGHARNAKGLPERVREMDLTKLVILSNITGLSIIELTAA